MGLMAKNKKKVLRIIEFDERNNKTLSETNIELKLDTTLKKAKDIFKYNTMFKSKKSEYSKLRFDVITYEIDIVDRKDISLIGAKNYKDKEYNKFLKEHESKERAVREYHERNLKEYRERKARESDK